MVTAELALGLLVCALVAVVALWAVGIGAQQLLLGDIAVQAARQDARGDDAAVDEVRHRARGTTITIRHVDGTTVATAVTQTRPFGVLPRVELTAAAVAALEPGEQ